MGLVHAVIVHQITGSVFTFWADEF